MRNAFNQFALVCASLVLSALILEVSVRSFVDMPILHAATPGVIVRDAREFWAMEPGRQFVFDNGIDFRDKSAKIDADGGRQIPCAGGVHGDARRIILIGDSQTFGVGLSDNETWANWLQCRLNSTGEEPAKVHNLGVPGTGVDEYFRRGMIQVAPSVVPGDIVVVSVTWNDLHTFYTGEGWLKTVLAISGLREKDTGNAKTAAVEALPDRPEDRVGTADRSLLAMQLKIPVHRLNKPTWRYRVYRDYGVLIPAFGSFWEFGQSMVYVSAAFRLAWSRARLIYYRFRPSDELFRKIPKRAFKANFLALKALDTLLQRRGVEMLIQLLPNRLFFDDFYYRAYSKNGVVFPARDFIGHVSQPFCTSLKLKCLNRFADLQTAERDAHTFAFDGHYNELGAARIGEALAIDLKAKLQ